MDHVINSMQEWLRIYEMDKGTEHYDKEAVKRIKAAIRELKKYYKGWTPDVSHV